MRVYGLREVWVKRGSTVFVLCHKKDTGIIGASLNLSDSFQSRMISKLAIHSFRNFGTGSQMIRIE